MNSYLWTPERRLTDSITGMFCCKNFYRQYDLFLEICSISNKTVHRARDMVNCVAVLHTSLLQTCGHLTHRTSTLLTLPSAQSCSSVCIRPESMTSTSCDSVLSPCGVDWNSALWMTPLISGNVVCRPLACVDAEGGHFEHNEGL